MSATKVGGWRTIFICLLNCFGRSAAKVGDWGTFLHPALPQLRLWSSGLPATHIGGWVTAVPPSGPPAKLKSILINNYNILILCFPHIGGSGTGQPAWPTAGSGGWATAVVQLRCPPAYGLSSSACLPAARAVWVRRRVTSYAS